MPYIDAAIASSIPIPAKTRARRRRVFNGTGFLPPTNDCFDAEVRRSGARLERVSDGRRSTIFGDIQYSEEEHQAPGLRTDRIFTDVSTQYLRNFDGTVRPLIVLHNLTHDARHSEGRVVE